MLEEPRVCVSCGERFEPRRSGGKPQRYCSTACRRKTQVKARTISYQQRPEREFACVQCGQRFRRIGQGNHRRFCSETCMRAHDREQRSTFAYDRKQSPEHIAKRVATMQQRLATQTRICEHCGVKYTPTSAPQRYCSGQCWNAVAAKRRKNPPRVNVPKALYDQLYAQQGGVCGICRKSGNGRHRLCGDHDHVTKQIRGLLCHRCNTAIGLFLDDPELLQAAIHYLETRA